MSPDAFFARLWEDYIAIAPAAGRLRTLVEAEGETVRNDHVAFRTFNRGPIHLGALEPHLFQLGYRVFDTYEFREKRLEAKGYVHPDGYPRVFLSELKTEEFSRELQDIVDRLVRQVDPHITGEPEVFWAGTPWAPVDFGVYTRLLEESEYAAWVAALGLRANHFTIAVNELEKLKPLEALLDFVESKGFELNTGGGRIKGSPEVLLRQASTLADVREVPFAGGRREPIRTCYYEFAERYPGPDGRLYDGFVAASADKIFQSTDMKPGGQQG